MASWPKGQKEKLPITKQALAQGRPTIVMAQSTPASHQPRPITSPPSTNHRTFSRKLSMDLEIRRGLVGQGWVGQGLDGTKLSRLSAGL